MERERERDRERKERVERKREKKIHGGKTDGNIGIPKENDGRKEEERGGGNNGKGKQRRGDAG